MIKLSDLEKHIEEILAQRPELTRMDVEEKIKLKKEKIGAGYLTDQGALFLIASDLGIMLSESTKSEVALKDIYSGAKEVSLETRVLNLSPAKQFLRKDGSPFYLRTMTVYDGNSTASVKLWDEKANLPNIESLKPGDLIKIIKAYVKEDLDGTPAINIGSNSNIEIMDSESSIPPIDTLTKDVSELNKEEKDLVVSGTIEGMINEMRYTDSKGQPKKALRMRIKGKDGSEMKVVLWGKTESEIPNMISKSAKVKLLGVSARSRNQELEIHGNDATIMHVEGSNEIEPVVARILSISVAESGKNLILAADGKKNLYNINDSANSTVTCAEGDIIECMPSKVQGSSITLDDNSFVRKLDDDESIPSLSQVRTKIDKIKVGEYCCIEAIVLKISERREVQTKAGESVSFSKMFIEDDTGQIWVNGWRNQARLVDKCELGEVVSITGLNTKPSFEGGVELLLTAFSKITKKD